MADIFSIMPVEIFQDKRLTLWHIRVLGALLSFRSKNTDTVWPSRQALSERLGGMNLSNISTVTTELCELGWLVKEGDGGRSKATRYKITVPDLETVVDSATVSGTQTVVDSATVVKSTTVVDSATPNRETVVDSATKTVVDSATGKEQTSDLTTKSNRPGAAAKAAAPDDELSAFQESCRSTWAAYSSAYQNRYHVEPVRNKRVNSQIVEFVKRLGGQEAPLVAGYYLSHNGRYYVGRCHDVGSMLADAEKLRTEWATGRQVTTIAAQRAEQTADNLDTHSRALELARQRGHAV